MRVNHLKIPKGVNEGMPPLVVTQPSLSFFEFWPAWVMYAPIIFQWIVLSIRYRSFSLPLIANPTIPLSGMVGESKADILDQVQTDGRHYLCEYITTSKNPLLSLQQNTQNALDAYAQAGLSLPAVVKPDLGCRGAGVRLIESPNELASYLDAFPDNARFLLQQKSQYQAEAGVFYIRFPHETKGRITSITLKYTPWVIGDGHSTLEQLILNNERAGQLPHIYLPRHAARLHVIIPKDDVVRLAFAGSHSRGSIFRNGNEYITSGLTEALDDFFNAMPGFHYGRLDLKFKDIDDLMQGKHFEILETNGASSEATHIWDSRTRFTEAIGVLLFQYRTLFKIGALNRQAGHKPPSLMSLYRAWREEKKWVRDYPSTD